MITRQLSSHFQLVREIVLAESECHLPIVTSSLSRALISNSLAYLEMRIVLARLLWNFDLIGLAPSCENWASQNVYLFWDKPELLVQLKPIMKGTHE